MRNIKNRDEIVEKLTCILLEFEKSLNEYQTDVYLYYNQETQIAELDTFMNVGGNSWINDDHYTIFTDNQHCDSWLDWYSNEKDFANALDIVWDDFKNEVVEFLRDNGQLDNGEKFTFTSDRETLDDEKYYFIEYDDVINYVVSKEDYMDKLKIFYDEYIDNELRPEIFERAENLISEWETEE